MRKSFPLWPWMERIRLSGELTSLGERWNRTENLWCVARLAMWAVVMLRFRIMGIAVSCSSVTEPSRSR